MSIHREVLFYATEGFTGLELKDSLRVCHGACIMPETNQCSQGGGFLNSGCMFAYLLMAKRKCGISLIPVKTSLHLLLGNQVKSSLSFMRTRILALTNTRSHDPFVLMGCLFQTGRKATAKTRRYTRLHNLLRRLAGFRLSPNN